MCTEKLVKSSTLAVVPGCLVALFLKPLIKEVGVLLMLLYFSISVGNGNRSPPVDRIVLLQAILSCNYSAANGPNCQVVGLEDIPMAHCSYRCVPVGKLAAS